MINSATQGGFFFNIVTANANIWNYQEVAGRVIAFSLFTFGLGLIAFTFLLAERLGNHTRTWPLVLPYYFAAILVTLVVGKAGSNDGTLFELSAALCLCAGAAVAWMKNDWVRAAVLVVIAMQIGYFSTVTSEQFQPKFDYNMEPGRAGAIGQSGAPGRWSHPGRRVYRLLPLAGKRLYDQPFEYNQFAQAGLWDPAPLMNELSQRKFALLLLYFPKNFQSSQSPWPGNVHESMYANYDVVDTLAYTLVLRPKK